MKSFENIHIIMVSESDVLDKVKATGLPKKFRKSFNTNNLTGIRAIILIMVSLVML